MLNSELDFCLFFPTRYNSDRPTRTAIEIGITIQISHYRLQYLQVTFGGMTHCRVRERLPRQAYRAMQCNCLIACMHI